MISASAASRRSADAHASVLGFRTQATVLCGAASEKGKLFVGFRQSGLLSLRKTATGKQHSCRLLVHNYFAWYTVAKWVGAFVSSCSELTGQ